jgi:hypothetical protein
LPILSVKTHSSLIQEASPKVQDSSLPDLLCRLSAVPTNANAPAQHAGALLLIDETGLTHARQR